MSVAQPAGYAGTPLPKKLGIMEGMTVALIGAPLACRVSAVDATWSGLRFSRRKPA